MKTLEQIDEALSTICIRLVVDKGLTDMQTASIAGAVAALSWAADNANADALEALLGGKPIRPTDGKGPQEALANLKASLEVARETLGV